MLDAASFARAGRRWDGARANEVSTGTGGGRIPAAGRGEARFRAARARVSRAPAGLGRRQGRRVPNTPTPHTPNTQPNTPGATHEKLWAEKVESHQNRMSSPMLGRSRKF